MAVGMAVVGAGGAGGCKTEKLTKKSCAALCSGSLPGCAKYTNQMGLQEAVMVLCTLEDRAEVAVGASSSRSLLL